MKIEYYEEMLEQEAINNYLNMIANDYNGELARIFEEKYINKDKEIDRLNKGYCKFKEQCGKYAMCLRENQLKEIEKLNNIIKRFEVDLRDMYITFGEFSEEYTEKKIKELKGESNEKN